MSIGLHPTFSVAQADKGMSIWLISPSICKPVCLLAPSPEGFLFAPPGADLGGGWGVPGGGGWKRRFITLADRLPCSEESLHWV